MICLDPLLWSKYHVLSRFSQKQFIVIRFLLKLKIPLNDFYYLLNVGMKHRIQVTLHDVASEDQKQNVEICGLIVTELDETIIDKKSVVLCELESPMA